MPGLPTGTWCRRSRLSESVLPAPITWSVRMPARLTRMFSSHLGFGTTSAPRLETRPWSGRSPARTQRVPSNPSRLAAFQYALCLALTRSTTRPSRGQSIGPYVWSQANCSVSERERSLTNLSQLTQGRLTSRPGPSAQPGHRAQAEQRGCDGGLRGRAGAGQALGPQHRADEHREHGAAQVGRGRADLGGGDGVDDGQRDHGDRSPAPRQCRGGEEGQRDQRRAAGHGDHHDEVVGAGVGRRAAAAARSARRRCRGTACPSLRAGARARWRRPRAGASGTSATATATITRRRRRRARATVAPAAAPTTTPSTMRPGADGNSSVAHCSPTNSASAATAHSRTVIDVRVSPRGTRRGPGAQGGGGHAAAFRTRGPSA